MALEFEELDVFGEEALLEQLLPEHGSLLELTPASTISRLSRKPGRAVDTLSLEEVRAAGGLASAARRPRYEAIVLLDLLGFVRGPASLLAQCLDLLSPAGFVAAVVPNATYGALRLSQLRGFDEAIRGHRSRIPPIHVFTIDLLESVFQSAGYVIAETLRSSIPWDDAPLVSQAGIDAADLARIREEHDHSVAAYVVKAVPQARALTGTDRAFAATLRELEAAIATRDEALARLHAIDASAAKFAGEERARRESLEAALRTAQDERMSYENRAEYAERIAYEQTSALLEATKVETARLSELIDAVQTSTFWRLKRFLRSLRGLLIR